MMKKYDLIVVSAEPFPNGHAATNRMLSYLTGLAQRKDILYLCLASPSSSDSPNKKKEGCFSGIYFQYISNPIINHHRNSLFRALSLFWRHCLIFILLILFYKAKAVLIYSSKRQLTTIVQVACKIRATPLYRDITELVGYNYSHNKKDIAKMKNNLASYSGLITISQGIYNYFDNIPIEKKFLLPVLVDISRFEGHKDSENYFFCCSGANLERDGLLDSLNGFLLFNNTTKGYTFEIATYLDLTNPYHIKCKEIIDSHSDVIHYLGSFPSYEIPSKMSHATALMLTPHSNYQTKGFPTKLGEYLASGTPTICSSTDDLMSVVSCKTAYIVKPNAPDMIAETLQLIVNNPEEASIIGSNGRQLMINKYTISSYEERLINFLKI